MLFLTAPTAKNEKETATMLLLTARTAKTQNDRRRMRSNPWQGGSNQRKPF